MSQTVNWSFWFWHLLKFKNIDFNHVLLTTLVERWRSETHTFHFPLGETTVTLEDVELILGLPVDGEAVIGITTGDLVSLCEQFLGFIPPAQRWKEMQLICLGLTTLFRNCHIMQPMMLLLSMLNHIIDFNKDNIGGCTLL